MTKRTKPTTTSVLRDYLSRQPAGESIARVTLQDMLTKECPGISKGTPDMAILAAVRKGALVQVARGLYRVTKDTRKWSVKGQIKEDHAIGKFDHSKSKPREDKPRAFLPAMPRQMDMFEQAGKPAAPAQSSTPANNPQVKLTPQEKWSRFLVKASADTLHSRLIDIVSELANRARKGEQSAK